MKFVLPTVFLVLVALAIYPMLAPAPAVKPLASASNQIDEDRPIERAVRAGSVDDNENILIRATQEWKWPSGVDPRHSIRIAKLDGKLRLVWKIDLKQRRNFEDASATLALSTICLGRVLNLGSPLDAVEIQYLAGYTSATYYPSFDVAKKMASENAQIDTITKSTMREFARNVVIEDFNQIVADETPPPVTFTVHTHPEVQRLKTIGVLADIDGNNFVIKAGVWSKLPRAEKEKYVNTMHAACNNGAITVQTERGEKAVAVTDYNGKIIVLR